MNEVAAKAVSQVEAFKAKAAQEIAAVEEKAAQAVAAVEQERTTENALSMRLAAGYKEAMDRASRLEKARTDLDTLYYAKAAKAKKEYEAEFEKAYGDKNNGPNGWIQVRSVKIQKHKRGEPKFRSEEVCNGVNRTRSSHFGVDLLVRLRVPGTPPDGSAEFFDKGEFGHGWRRNIV
jgi:hypothetical protein